MLRFFRLWSLFCLVLAAPSLAQGQAPQPPAAVEWSVQISGDTLHIDAKTSAGQPAQRLNASPSFLELTFPKAKLTGGSLNKAVDRGLVQKVQTNQDGSAVSIRVFVLTKPKATLTKTADGYRYSIRMSEPAGSPTPAASKPATPKPVAAAKPTAPAAPKGAETAPPAPSVDSKPTKPAAEPVKPAAQIPSQPVQPPTQPAQPAAQPAQPAVATATPSGKDPRQLITVVFQNRPIGEALKELAQQAGYSAQIDPTLSGAVNLSLSEVPFEDALSLLLEPYGKSVTSNIGPQSISVKRNAAAPVSSTASSVNSSMEGVVFEYYPFTNKDAQKIMDAVSKAVPELTYRVDPTLNVLLVQGPREQMVKLGDMLKNMSTK